MKVAKPCNCRIKAECPLRGECQEGPLVYQADVATIKTVKKYIGQTGDTFKSRYYGHKSSLDNGNKNSTTMSTYVWKQLEKRQKTLIR